MHKERLSLAIIVVAFTVVSAAAAAAAAPGHAASNCDSANLGANDQGHIRGNSHCSTGVEPKEPARDCGHTNSEKDNDGDTATVCINRG